MTQRVAIAVGRYKQANRAWFTTPCRQTMEDVALAYYYMKQVILNKRCFLDEVIVEHRAILFS